MILVIIKEREAAYRSVQPYYLYQADNLISLAST